MIGISKVAVALLLVISVAPATIKHMIRFITHISMWLNTFRLQPTIFERPELLKK